MNPVPELDNTPERDDPDDARQDTIDWDPTASSPPPSAASWIAEARVRHPIRTHL